MNNRGIFPMLGASFITTSYLESLHAMIEELVPVDHWENLTQKHRWVVAALMRLGSDAVRFIAILAILV